MEALPPFLPPAAPPVAGFLATLLVASGSPAAVGGGRLWRRRRRRVHLVGHFLLEQPPLQEQKAGGPLEDQVALGGAAAARVAVEAARLVLPQEELHQLGRLAHEVLYLFSWDPPILQLKPDSLGKVCQSVFEVLFRINFDRLITKDANHAHGFISRTCLHLEASAQHIPLSVIDRKLLECIVQQLILGEYILPDEHFVSLGCP